MEQIDVKELIRVLNKILQAYRIRLQVMERRKKWVDSLLSRRDDIRGIPDIDFTYLRKPQIVEMRSLLRYERRLLKIIRAEEREEENLIIKTLEYLNNAVSIFHSNKRKEISQQLRRHGLKIKDLQNMMSAAIRMLEAIRRDMEYIMRRIYEEERFIENPNKYSFGSFVGAWRWELLFNERLNEDLKVFMKKEKRQFNILIAMLGFKQAATGALAGQISGGLVGASMGAIHGQPQLGGRIGMEVGAILFALVSIGNFVVALRKTQEEELAKEGITTSRLIRKLNTVTA